MPKASDRIRGVPGVRAARYDIRLVPSRRWPGQHDAVLFEGVQEFGVADKLGGVAPVPCEIQFARSLRRRTLLGNFRHHR